MRKLGIAVMTAAMLMTAAAVSAGDRAPPKPQGANATAIGVGIGGDAKANSSSAASNTAGSSSNVEAVRQAPSVSVFASGPCTGFAGGISAPIGGVAVGLIEAECQKREAARIGLQSEDPEIRAAAKRVYMSLDAVRDVAPAAPAADETPASTATPPAARPFWCARVTPSSSAADRAACAR